MNSAGTPETDSAPTAGGSGPAPQALLLVHVLTAAAFIVILNETIMSNAIPVIMHSFGITPSTAQWLSTAFLLTMAVTIPVTGWLIGRLGTRRSLMLAMGLFCSGTLLALVAPVFGVLLVARVVQALGTAVMVPLLMTTLLRVIPERFRGQVMGSVMLAISVAPALGPPISGLILEYLTWRWIFGIVLPLAVVITLVCLRLLPNEEEIEHSGERVDVLGVLLCVVGFGGLVWGLSGLGEGSSGGEGPVVPPWLSLVVGAIAVALLVWRQLRLRRAGHEPLLDVTAFRYRDFGLGIVMMTIGFGAFLGVMIVLPLVLQQVRGVSVLVAGLCLMPAGLLMGLLGPTVGRQYDARGARGLVMAGSLFVVVGIGLLAWLVEDAPVWLLAVVMGIVGIGLALMLTPLFTASLAPLTPDLYPHGSAILNTLQQVGGAAGTAAMISVFSWATALGDVPDAARGGRYALATAALLGVATLVLSPLIPSGRPEAHSGHGGH